jgi:hypothetical protein
LELKANGEAMMKRIGSCKLVDCLERMIDGRGFNFEMVYEDYVYDVRCF